jgi:hypothetical protein
MATATVTMFRLAGLAAVLLAVLVAAANGQPQTPPERKPACVVLAVRPDAILEQCGERLRAINIALRDIARVTTLDGTTGSVAFGCPVKEMCGGEPSITGWLIDPRRWTRGPRDEAALFNLLQAPPAVMARRMSPPADPLRPKPSCLMFDVQIAGMPGRAACYLAEDEKSVGIFAVVANEEAGFVLAFRSDELDTTALREKVLTILPRFQIEVATGDYGLLRWMR